MLHLLQRPEASGVRTVNTANLMQTTYFKNKTMVSQVQTGTSNYLSRGREHQSAGKGWHWARGTGHWVEMIQWSTLRRAAVSGKVLSILEWPTALGWKQGNEWDVMLKMSALTPPNIAHGVLRVSLWCFTGRYGISKWSSLEQAYQAQSKT